MWDGCAHFRTSFHSRSYWANGENIENTYVKADLNQVVNNTSQMNAEKRTLLLSLLKYLEDLFDGTSCDWFTEPFNIE